MRLNRKERRTKLDWDKIMTWMKKKRKFYKK